jgi:N-acetylglucosamine malate deacetylase 1
MKVLFVVAHPHYPACYMAGTVANHVSQGDEVYVVSMTKGEKVTDVYPEDEVRRINVAEMDAAAKELGICEVRYLGVEDTCVMITDELRLKLVECIREIRPDIVITHWKEDSHPDVRATAEMVEDCIFLSMIKQGKWNRKFPPHVTKALYAFDMPGYSRHFEPTHYIDVTKCLEIKRSAMLCLKLHLSVDTNGDVDKWLSPVLLSNAKWALNTLPQYKYVEAYRRIRIHEALDDAVSCLPL